MAKIIDYMKMTFRQVKEDIERERQYDAAKKKVKRNRKTGRFCK